MFFYLEVRFVESNGIVKSAIFFVYFVIRIMKAVLVYILSLSIIMMTVIGNTSVKAEGECHVVTEQIESSCCKAEMEEAHQECNQENKKPCDDHKKDCCKDYCCCLKLQKADLLLLTMTNTSVFSESEIF